MSGTKKTFAMFGGAAALAFALGFGGGVGVNALGSTTAATTQPAPSLRQRPPRQLPASTSPP